MTRRPKPKPDPARPGKYLPNGAAAKAGLNKAILDVGWGEFRRQLEYKTAKYGRRLIVIDRWYPSSKTCSSCGYLLADLEFEDQALDVPVLPYPARPGHQRGEEHSCGRSCRRHRERC